MSKSSHYQTYMNSERWSKKRKEALENARYKCQKCNTIQRKGLHVHHLTYERLGDELLEDLQVLCRRCHASQHPGKMKDSMNTWTGKRFRVVRRGQDFVVFDWDREVVTMRTEAGAIRFAQGADSVGSLKPRREPMKIKRHRYKRPPKPRQVLNTCQIYKVDPEILKEWGTRAAIDAAES